MTKNYPNSFYQTHYTSNIIFLFPSQMTSDHLSASPTSSSYATKTNNVINSSSSSSAGNVVMSRDVTFKPKPIKAQRHVENTIHYTQHPSYAFNSPKNPQGLSPFQPTGYYLQYCYTYCKSPYRLNLKYLAHTVCITIIFKKKS